MKIEKQYDTDMVVSEVNWCTYYIVEEQLVVHVTLNMRKIYKIKGVVDPDGVPLVLLEPDVVTRVRKMTDDEFNSAIADLGMIKDEPIKETKV